ncbi:UNVERIFIED_CONTAM: hypothetical protein HHA_304920 [Hammondia hammondi]|eukprot:XP_008886751.1 hypothetical protein HHA_304920 [Hammondia hammondi]
MGKPTVLMFLLLSVVFVESEGEQSFADGDMSSSGAGRLTGASYSSPHQTVRPRHISAAGQNEVPQLRRQAGRLSRRVEDREQDCSPEEQLSDGEGHTADREPAEGGAHWRIMADTSIMTQQRKRSRETFLLVSVADERSLQEASEGTRARLSVNGIKDKTEADAQTQSQALGIGQEETTYSGECTHEAPGPPIVVRLAKRLKLTSFALSNAICLEGMSDGAVPGDV